jgi:hypothetical protein
MEAMSLKPIEDVGAAIDHADGAWWEGTSFFLRFGSARPMMITIEVQRKFSKVYFREFGLKPGSTIKPVKDVKHASTPAPQQDRGGDQ